jgi:DNA-binding MarR family transcriptional regulator
VSYNHYMQGDIPGAAPQSGCETASGAITDSRQPVDDITAVADLLHQINRDIRQVMTGHQDSHEPPVTMGQIRALRQVCMHDGPMRMSELADQLHIARRSATTVVDALVDRGLLNRSDDPDDRRSVLIDITDAGLAEMRAALDRRRSAAARVLDNLDPGDLAELRRLLTAVVR